MLARIELLVVWVARPDKFQADAAFLLSRNSLDWPSPELSPWLPSSTDCSNIFPPEFLHTILDVDDTEAAELSLVPLPEDLDVLVRLLGCQLGELGEQLGDESVSVPDSLTLLRAGAGLHCSC